MIDTNIGFVVIGRNEAECADRCIEAIVASEGADVLARCVYADSGSTDGSPQRLAAKGVHVVHLSPAVPFTAARGRNEGMRALLSLAPQVEFVQFVDGDCVMAPGWPSQATAFLREHGSAAVVSGAVHERYPEASIYNRACEREWQGPAGLVESCGGIVMMRRSALEEVGGFRTDLAGGEEPELCIRLRQRGWQIWRTVEDMATHDAALMSFPQWWRRMVRNGRAFAVVSALHSQRRGGIWARETRRALTWGLVLPAGIGAAMLIASPAAAVLFAVYPLQIARIAMRDRAQPGAWSTAALLTIGKVPECIGVLEAAMSRRVGPGAA